MSDPMPFPPDQVRAVRGAVYDQHVVVLALVGDADLTSDSGAPMRAHSLRLTFETGTDERWHLAAMLAHGHYVHDGLVTPLAQVAERSTADIAVPPWVADLAAAHIPPNRGAGTGTEQAAILAELADLDDDTLTAANRALRNVDDSLRVVGGLGDGAPAVRQIGTVRRIVTRALDQRSRDRRAAARAGASA